MSPVYQRARARNVRLRVSNAFGALALFLACCACAVNAGTVAYSCVLVVPQRYTSQRDQSSILASSERSRLDTGCYSSDLMDVEWLYGIREKHCPYDRVCVSLAIVLLQNTWQWLMSSVPVAISVAHCGVTNISTRAESGRDYWWTKKETTTTVAVRITSRIGLGAREGELVSA